MVVALNWKPLDLVVILAHHLTSSGRSGYITSGRGDVNSICLCSNGGGALGVVTRTKAPKVTFSIKQTRRIIPNLRHWGQSFSSSGGGGIFGLWLRTLLKSWKFCSRFQPACHLPDPFKDWQRSAKARKIYLIDLAKKNMHDIQCILHACIPSVLEEFECLLGWKISAFHKPAQKVLFEKQFSTITFMYHTWEIAQKWLWA